MIQIKRAYDRSKKSDGTRFLVDRLWPRGVRKEELKLHEWPKEVAPSDGLRRWFNHDPAKWREFQRRYRAELTDKREIWQPLLDFAKQGDITLLFSAHDLKHNNAVVLKSFLDQRLRRKTPRKRRAARH